MHKSAYIVLDTGSSYLTLPEDIYHDLIWIKFGHEEYCDKSKDIFPTLTYKVHQKFFELRASDYIKKPHN